MPKNIELGVRLTADGRGFVGAITVSQKTVRKLRGETDKAAASTRGMAGAMRQAERSAQGAAGGFLAAHGRIGFPRTRGDRPPSSTAESNAKTVPPHTRG